MMNRRTYRWALACAAGVVGWAGVSRAATLSQNATPPSTNIIASQLTDLGPGPQANDRDYTDNGGPAGQTFTVGGASFLNAITILGRGDAGGNFNTGNFHIQIGSINPGTGQITQLANESASAVPATANNTYLTFTLDTPVPVAPGTTYSFSIFNEPAGWYGLAHSTGDAYAGGQAFNNDLTTTSAGNADPRRTFNGFVSPNPGGYDYVFAAQGVVPEPGSLAGLGLADLAVLARRGRSRG
jgi:hypothetical protein